MRNRKKILNHTLITLITLTVYVGLFIFNTEIKESVAAAISICINTIIPTLFPVMVVSGFLSALGLPSFIRKSVYYLLKPITGLSEETAEIFIFGSTGGYPLGIKTAAAFLKRGSINEEEAKRAALSNVNPGLSFGILVTGLSFYGSLKAGLSLYLSVCFGNLLTAFILKTVSKNKTRGKNNGRITNVKPDVSELLISSVSSSVKAVALMCGWILIFSAVSAPIRTLTKSEFLRIFLEVTDGVIYCVEEKNPAICAFTLSFGGLCILFQLLPDLKDLGISPVTYLLCRTLSGVFAYGSEKLILVLFPSVLAVFNSGSVTVKASVSNSGGTIALCFMCFIFMLSLEGSQNKRIRR